MVMNRLFGWVAFKLTTQGKFNKKSFMGMDGFDKCESLQRNTFGHGFKSRHLHHMGLWFSRLEHTPDKREVGGSSPSKPTIVY